MLSVFILPWALKLVHFVVRAAERCGSTVCEKKAVSRSFQRDDELWQMNECFGS